MPVFERYAQFYDVMYGEKNYEAECDFLEQIFRRYAGGGVKSILDLGCGTGGHLLPLVERGFRDLAGVDRSPSMLDAARLKAEKAATPPVFQQGDIREVRLGRTFDAVICMFAVMCYQTTNEDLEAAIRTARAHLEPGGLFAFDGWFGPGVFSDPPQPRMKIIEVEDEEKLIRLANPGKIDARNQTLSVHYTLLRLKGNALLEHIEEVHPMRFLFAQETRLLLEKNGFECLHLSPFLDLDHDLDLHDWQMSVVGRAV